MSCLVWTRESLRRTMLPSRAGSKRCLERERAAPPEIQGERSGAALSWMGGFWRSSQAFIAGEHEKRYTGTRI